MSRSVRMLVESSSPWHIFIHVVAFLCSLESAFGQSCVRGHGEFGKRLTCSKITSEQELGQMIKLEKNYDPRYFVLSNSELRFIRHDAFKGTKIKEISIEFTNLMSLSDSGVAFEGLGDTLEKINVDECSFVGEWNWNQLRNLRNLKTIKIILSDIDYVSKMPNFAPSQKKGILFGGNAISALSPTAFSDVRNLVKIYLDGNQIVTIERSMFPKPAESLCELDLSRNKIKTLPSDIFTEMPVLEMLYIEKNQLHTINEEVFRPVWNHLKIMQFKGNDLICDCRINWILESSNKNKLQATCQQPSNLLGKSVADLENNDLWC